MAKISRRPSPSHPLAVPPVPGTFGVWQVRRVRDAPLGYVLSHSEHGVYVYHCYAHAHAHGRDPAGGRPWLRRMESLNSAVAWMIQHEADLFALTETVPGFGPRLAADFLAAVGADIAAFESPDRLASYRASGASF